jgi:hypothetical protein
MLQINNNNKTKSCHMSTRHALMRSSSLVECGCNVSSCVPTTIDKYDLWWMSMVMSKSSGLAQP